MLRKIFGLKRDEVIGDWRRPLNEELRDLYCSLNIVHFIKSRRMGCTGHIARMWDRRDAR